MTWPVLLLVLFGALLHASWNALVKSSSDKTLDTALIHVLCSLLALPVCLYVGPPPAESWPYILGSLVVHVGYYFALAGAYRHGELGLTYPLMRGTAPMLVALTSFAFIGEDLTPLAWLGVACISGGVLLLGITREWWTHRKAILFALCNAVLIALYTVIDAKGARSSGHVVQYISMLFVLDGWPFAILVFMQRKGQVWPYVRKRWVGHDRRACGHGSRAARNIGFFCSAHWRLVLERSLDSAKNCRHCCHSFWCCRTSFGLVL
ncbi:MAG: hypothetical protein RI994_1660 [Pseudomonadota bacterium]